MCGTVDRIDCVIRSRNLTRQAVAVKSFITSAVKTCIAIHVVRKGKKKKKEVRYYRIFQAPFLFSLRNFDIVRWYTDTYLEIVLHHFAVTVIVFATYFETWTMEFNLGSKLTFINSSHIGDFNGFLISISWNESMII